MGASPETILKMEQGVASPRAGGRGYEKPGAVARHENGWPRVAFWPDPQNGSGAVPGPTTPRWSAERRRPGCTGRSTPRKRGVAPHQRDSKAVRLPALRLPLGSGSELQLMPRMRARAQPKQRQVQRRRGGDKEGRRDNPDAENAPRERDRPGGTKPPGGLFDIVKNDAARATLCIRAGSRTHIWKPHNAAQAPVSLGCTGDGWPGAKPVRTGSGFRSRHCLGRMVASKSLQLFAIMRRPGRRHGPDAARERRRVPLHAAARPCASNRQSPGHAYGTRRATFQKRGNIHVQLSSDV